MSSEKRNREDHQLLVDLAVKVCRTWEASYTPELGAAMGRVRFVAMEAAVQVLDTHILSMETPAAASDPRTPPRVTEGPNYLGARLATARHMWKAGEIWAGRYLADVDRLKTGLETIRLIAAECVAAQGGWDEDPDSSSVNAHDVYKLANAALTMHPDLWGHGGKPTVHREPATWPEEREQPLALGATEPPPTAGGDLGAAPPCLCPFPRTDCPRCGLACGACMAAKRDAGRGRTAEDICGHQFANGSVCTRAWGHRHGDLSRAPRKEQG